MKAVLLATDIDTGDVQEIELDNSGDVFKGTFEVKESHDYELKVRAEESSFYRESAPVKISAKAGGAATTSPSTGTGKEEPLKEASSIPCITLLVVFFWCWQPLPHGMC